MLKVYSVNLKNEIQRRILDNINWTYEGPKSPRQFVKHVLHVEHENINPKYTAADRAELHKILNAVGLEKDSTSLMTGIRLLRMLDWSAKVKNNIYIHKSL